jgi:phosphotransferase system enzyme I (PtsI)
MMMIQGIGISASIAIGKAFVIRKAARAGSNSLLNTEADVRAEIESFDIAVNRSVKAIEAIIVDGQLSLQDEAIAILETQIELINDPQIRTDVVDLIELHKKPAFNALIEVIQQAVSVFEGMDDEYMRARSADIKDIGSRILANINFAESTNIQAFLPGSIIVAHDLSPSDTITMDVNLVAGFVTGTGSKTSHTAIIAKSKYIPAILGCGEALAHIETDDLLILDGLTGIVLINPNEDIISRYKLQMERFKAKAEQLKQLKSIPAITSDGIKITLSANITNAGEVEAVFENGGDGVGLLRTEMLFMDRGTFPTEDEQFEFYKQVALQSKGKPVIVRTIDIGGDKPLPYFNLPAELNPFLGYRAIRICLDRQDLFITQLKAILRASVLGDLKIMFPMISNVDEVRMAKQILSEAKNQLRTEGRSFNKNIPVGIMIEIPSAAVMADILAKEVDFFSIGTNDLCQYTLAVDRMNDKISHLYNPYVPGVLRLIDNVVQQGKKHNIHVGMCGEMASDPLATLLLIGMGLTDFSMSAASIPAIKKAIINNNASNAQTIYQEVMAMDSSSEITAYLKQRMQ